MKTSRFPLFHSRAFRVAFVCALALSPRLSVAQNQAQGGPPSIAYVYPAGGQQGTTITVAIGGQRLRGPEDVIVFPADGVVAVKVLRYERPLSVKEYNAIRDEARALQ